MSADKQLKAYIDRVLRLKEEQDTLGDDIREIYAEAKAEGYDKTIMGKLVAHLRKVQKSGEDAVSEQEMTFDTYLTAYHRASGTAFATHTHEEDFDRETGEVFDRDARRRQRTTEAMDDHKSLVDEMADAGLISEEARHENKALADAVATKFGNGPAKALQSPRKAAEAVAEMPRNNQPKAADEMQHPGSLLIGNPEPALAAANRPNGEDGMVRMARTEAAAVTDRRDDHLNSPIAPASQGEAEAPSVESVSPEIHGSSDANIGGDDVDRSAPRAGQADQTSNIGEGERELIKALPGSHPVLAIRPNCQHPGEEICGGSGRNHCRACTAAMREEEVT